MNIKTEYISLKTKGNTDIVDITNLLEEIIKKSKVSDGILVVFVPGATGAVTTIEYEPGLVKDTKELFEDIVQEEREYYHDESHEMGNATSHLRASLVGPSLTIPITNGILELGTWQQVVFIDFDNRPRNRKIIIKIIGE